MRNDDQVSVEMIDGQTRELDVSTDTEINPECTSLLYPGKDELPHAKVSHLKVSLYVLTHPSTFGIQ